MVFSKNDRTTSALTDRLTLEASKHQPTVREGEKMDLFILQVMRIWADEAGPNVPDCDEVP